MKKIWHDLGWIAVTIGGSALFAAGFSLFLQPNDLNSGGISGLAMVLVELLGFGSVADDGISAEEFVGRAFPFATLYRHARRSEPLGELLTLETKRIYLRSNNGDRRQALEVGTDEIDTWVHEVGGRARNVAEEPCHHRAVEGRAVRRVLV